MARGKPLTMKQLLRIEQELSSPNADIRTIADRYGVVDETIRKIRKVMVDAEKQRKMSAV